MEEDKQAGHLSTKPIPPAKVTKMEKALQKLNPLIDNVQGTIVACEADDMEPYIPKFQITKAKSCMADMREAKGVMEKWISEKKAVKTTMDSFMKTYGERASNWEELAEKIRGLLTDAEEAVANGVL